jgi:hypothetical protein
MHKIKILYDKIDSKDEDYSVFSIYIEFPEYKIIKTMFYYEFKKMDIFKKYAAKKALRLNLYFESKATFLELSEKEFNKLSEEIKDRTDYEEMRLNDGLQILSIRANMARRSPKFWEV